MSKRARRILITLPVSLIALSIVLVVFRAPAKQQQTRSPLTSDKSASSELKTTDSAETVTEPVDELVEDVDSVQKSEHEVVSLEDLHATAPEVASTAQQILGSLDPRQHKIRIELTRQGAGISSIAFSNIWESASAKRKAERYFKSLSKDSPIDFQQLDESKRYTLQTALEYLWGSESITVPIMAAHSIVINDQTVGLLTESLWSEINQGIYKTRIQNNDGIEIAEITRKFSLRNDYGIALEQSIRNLTSMPLNVKWQQYGPSGLRRDPSGYIDRRRFDFGFLPDPAGRPNLVLANDSDLSHERRSVLKLFDKAQQADLPLHEKLDLLTLWPNRKSRDSGYGLSWFASVNRYFGLAIHPLVDSSGSGNHSLNDLVEEIRLDVSGRNTSDTIFTFLVSPSTQIDPGKSASFDIGVYSGPLDRKKLNESPYSNIAMQGLILYQMSGCCTMCTFQWLAKFLLHFLSFLHSFMFDWGLSIIGLVVVVRTLLHPVTKKAQINMQRFGKQMSAMKPELDKLQKKFTGEPKKMQQEQMKLMREHGINPLQMLGCLPMFLQMPIWIALWAMLYLAFDLRQQPAFYGVFQLLGDWQFLGDLASQDEFLSLGSGFTIPLINVQITAVNALPLLMGFVFFFQQKYMSPPPSPTMTPEQRQQQAIMKWMMVIMFPLMLYKAPAGLTLYIFTSSCIGILESRYVRKHIDSLDLTAPKKESKPKKKIKDLQARLYANALERAKSKRKGDPTQNFKKRR